MTVFYLDRDSGELFTEPGAWSWPLEGFALRITRPLVIHCGVHNRYEAIGQVESAEVLDRGAGSLIAFARALLAASTPSCVVYRRWKAGLLDDYRAAVDRGRPIDVPLISYLALAEALHARVPFEPSLHNLATAAEPKIALPRSAVGQIPYLHPEDGLVRWHPRDRRPQEGVPLANSGWLFLRCQHCHRWECVDTLPPLTAIVTNVLTQYTRVLISQAVHSCDDYTMRIGVLQLPEMSQAIYPFAWFKACAKRIVQATEDVGWLVSRALDRLIDLN